MVLLNQELPLVLGVVSLEAHHLTCWLLVFTQLSLQLLLAICCLFLLGNCRPGVDGGPRGKQLLDGPAFVADVGVAVFGEEGPDVWGGSEGADSLDVFGEEADYCFEHGAYGPCGVPLFGVVLGDGEADFGVGLKPAVFVHEDDIWGLEGVLVGQQNLSVIDALVKVGVFGPLEREVPRVDIVFEGSRSQVGQLFLPELLRLGHNALLADIARLHMCENINVCMIFAVKSNQW